MSFLFSIPDVSDMKEFWPARNQKQPSSDTQSAQGQPIHVHLSTMDWLWLSPPWTWSNRLTVSQFCLHFIWRSLKSLQFVDKRKRCAPNSISPSFFFFFPFMSDDIRAAITASLFSPDAGGMWIMELLIVFHVDGLLLLTLLCHWHCSHFQVQQKNSSSIWRSLKISNKAMQVKVLVSWGSLDIYAWLVSRCCC